MSTAPSPLAVKLAARLFPKTADKHVLDIDRVLRHHHIEEWQRIRDENKLLPQFCENILVKGSRYHDKRFTSNHFFELQLMPPEPDNQYEVQFQRYAVPGRYWIYGFRYEREGSGRVVWGSEGTGVLSQDARLVKADLNKPQVVELFKQAFSVERVALRYRQETLELLRALAPKSKSYLTVHRMCEEMMKTRAERFAKQHETEGRANRVNSSL